MWSLKLIQAKAKMDRVRSALIELSIKKKSSKKLTGSEDLPPLLPQFSDADGETIPGAAQRVTEAGHVAQFNRTRSRNSIGKSATKFIYAVKDFNDLLELCRKDHLEFISVEDGIIHAIYSAPTGARAFSNTIADIIVEAERPWISELQISYAEIVRNALWKVYPLLDLSIKFVHENAPMILKLSPVKGIINGLLVLLQIAGQSDHAADFLHQLQPFLNQASRLRHTSTKFETIQFTVKEKCLELMTAFFEFLTSTLFLLVPRISTSGDPGKSILKSQLTNLDVKQNLRTAVSEFDKALLYHAIKLIDGLEYKRPAISDDREDSESSMAMDQLDLVRWRLSSSRTPGTLKWIYQSPDFENWRVKGSPATLWWTGSHGIGKSTIAAYIVELLEELYPDSIVLYFFCRRWNHRLSRISDIIRGFLWQLARKIPSVQRLLDDLVEEEALQFLQMVLQTPSLRENEGLFVVIDGLDESQSDTPLELQDLIRMIQTLPDSRLLVTSKSTVELSSILSSQIVRPIGTQQQDTKLHLRKRIDQSSILANAFRLTNRRNLMESVQQNANSFLSFSLTLSLGAQAVTAVDFANIMSSSQDIYKVYNKCLYRADRFGQLDYVKEMLIWLMGAERQLSMDEIQSAVEISTGHLFLDFNSIMNNYAGIFFQIHEDGPSRTIEVVHESIFDYVTCPLLGCDYIQISPSEVPEYLGNICIRHLSTPSSTPIRKYIMANWFRHVEQINRNASDLWKRVKLLHRFLNTDALVNWVTEEFMQDRLDLEFIRRIATLLYGWITAASPPISCELGDEVVKDWYLIMKKEGVEGIHTLIVKAVTKLCARDEGLADWNDILRASEMMNSAQ